MRSAEQDALATTYIQDLKDILLIRSFYTIMSSNAPLNQSQLQQAEKRAADQCARRDKIAGLSSNECGRREARPPHKVNILARALTGYEHSRVIICAFGALLPHT